MRIIKKILPVCMAIVMIAGIMTVFLGCKDTSRFKMLEDKNIVSVSDSYEEKDLYFISDDSNVYILKNKSLEKIESLSGIGASKIIATMFETLLLNDAGELYQIDESNYSISRIDVGGKCSDVSNGISYYAVLRENGSVLLSWDIGKEGNKYSGTQFKEIDLDKKVVQMVAYANPRYINGEALETHEKAVAMLDTDGDLWAYGDSNTMIAQDNFTQYGLNKFSQMEGVDIVKIAGGLSISFLGSDGCCYVLGIDIGMSSTFLESGQFIDTTRVFRIDKIKNAVNVSGNLDKLTVLTDDNVLYTYYAGSIKNLDFLSLIKNIGVDPDSNLFVCKLGTIAISDDGSITWCRDYGFLNERGKYHHFFRDYNLSDLVPLREFI